jgi:choline dehydrogenase-like flavoprotein
VLAASVIQSPLLLLKSGIRQGPVGDHFQCHPGVSMVGRFPDPVRMWTGATQGHEVIGLVSERIKFEALGFDMAVLASRVDGVGSELSRGIADFAHLASWGAAIRAESQGRVSRGWLGRKVRFDLTQPDVMRIRRALQVLGEMMFAAGAEWVSPGVHGWHTRVTDRAVMARFTDEAPLDARAYTSVVTHMFGTCRMGSDPATSVVRPDGLHHWIDRLYVADSSIFPTNTGVNPQTSILALATIIATRMAAG